MGITRAQIARQLLAEGGKIGNTTFQLARKRSDGKRPGYYGPDAGEGGMESDFGAGTYSDGGDNPIDRGEAPGGSNAQFAAARSAIEARTPKETFAQKFINQIKKLGKYSPTVNIAEGIGGFFRGAFDKLANLRGFNPDGTRRTQAQFEQARRDRINQNRISNIMGRDAPFTEMTLENLRNLGFTGPLDGLLGTTNVTRSGTIDGITNTNAANDLVAEQLSFPYDFMNTGDPYKDSLYDQDGNYKPSLNTLVADVSPADLMLNNMRGSKQYSLDNFKGFSGNQTLTQEELDGIRNRTITKPTGKFIT